MVGITGEWTHFGERRHPEDFATHQSIWEGKAQELSVSTHSAGLAWESHGRSMVEATECQSIEEWRLRLVLARRAGQERTACACIPPALSVVAKTTYTQRRQQWRLDGRRMMEATEC